MSKIEEIKKIVRECDKTCDEETIRRLIKSKFIVSQAEGRRFIWVMRAINHRMLRARKEACDAH